MTDSRITHHPILDFKDRGKKITFTFNEREIEAFENETIAAALHAAGVYVLKHSLHLKRPRGLFCAIGRCASCQMEVDGHPNVKICMTKVRDGMVVRTQNKSGDLL